MTENTIDLEPVYEHLRQNPDQMYIAPNGSFALALSNPEEDLYFAIVPPDGETFLGKTDEEMNQYVIDALLAL